MTPRDVFVLCALLGFLGCGKDDEGRKTYPQVGGGYCSTVTEPINTCTCGGPRTFNRKIIMNYLQGNDDEGEYAGDVEIIGGGHGFTGFMDTDGYIFTRIEDYEVADPRIDRVTYSGVFTGTSENADFAVHHETVGPDVGEPCEGKDCHFRMDYHVGACCKGADGYNVIALSGERIYSTEESVECVTSALTDSYSFTAEPE